ncbi:hypothetical protein D3C80_1998870 [compost metagenome]
MDAQDHLKKRRVVGVVEVARFHLAEDVLNQAGVLLQGGLHDCPQDAVLSLDAEQFPHAQSLIEDQVKPTSSPLFCRSRSSARSPM